MQHKFTVSTIRLLLALLIVISSAACASTTTPAVTAPTEPAASAPQADPATHTPAPTATQAAEPTTAPTATDQPPTATVVPTATDTPTEAPMAEPTPGVIGASGLSAWCLPEEVSVTALQKPLEPPQTARIGEMVEGALEIRNLPVSACVFNYTFDQPAQEGLKLQVYEQRAKSPWLTADLLPVEGHPEMVMAILRHTYIVAPPLWNVSYTFTVVDSAGQELRRDAVNLHRWTPTLCWNGQPPNPITLRCPLAQDLHPWDPSYGTPVPTGQPEEED